MSDNILEVSSLGKQYPAFELSDVSFSVPRGSITGFIGRNGAGKTTTLKCLTGLVHPDKGDIRYFSLPFAENEKEIKQRIGYAGGTVNYYKKKKIKTISEVSSLFYKNQSAAEFKRYLDKFSIDENKTPEQLSEGMKVKLNLALSLSHSAEFLILDEPTSGLDPVSREELLEIFLSLRDEGVSILFSTHIISDLERCADRIVYIKNGRIIYEDALLDFAGAFSLVKFDSTDDISAHPGAAAIKGRCRTKDGFTCLIRKEDTGLFSDKMVTVPSPEDIMMHLEKEEK